MQQAEKCFHHLKTIDAPSAALTCDKPVARPTASNRPGRRLILALCVMLSLLCIGAAHPAAAEAADQDLKAAMRKLEVAFANSDEAGMTAAVKQIARVGNAEAIQTLCKLDVIPPREAYLAVAKGLANVKDEDLVKVIAEEYAKAARKRVWTRQIMLIDALADDASGLGAQAFRSAVTDKHPKVRLAAIRALAQTQNPTRLHVELLIDSLRISEKLKDVGTPHLEARQALARFTQQVMKKHKDWSAWFKSIPDDYKPKIIEKQVQVEDHIDEENLVYYEVPVTSRRMLFIIDSSGSMSAAMKVTTTSEGGGQREEDSTRMERAKQELTLLLSKIPPYTGFNLIEFNSKIRPWKKSMQPWSRRNITDAVKFTKALNPGGGTSAKQALTEALENNLTADTIYFLTDGAPTDGTPKDILQDIELLNRFLRVRIHTIGFGAGGQTLLKPLAEQNNGKYQLIDAP